MKAVILAGGYAKRLWPLTRDTPKSLLKVGNKEIITLIIEKLKKINISEIIISTNKKFKEKFEEYIQGTNLKLIIEPTLSEEKKLGSIGGLNYIIDKLNIDENTIIIGGDNIFEFDLNKFIDFFKENGTCIALKQIDDKELIKKYGVCTLDNNKIINFQEKPEEPKSNLASTACYLFKIEELLLIKKYLEQGNSPDAFGNFISWLIKQTNIFGFPFEEDWFDIGSLEQLEEADKKYSGK